MARVLVVDDDPSMRALIRLVLESEGYDTAEASDGQSALDSVLQEIPDVITLDLMMPHMDGWLFLENLRERGLRRKTRVVIVSALSDSDTLARGEQEGARAHLVKPFELVALVDAVRSALDNPPDELLAKQERIGELTSLMRRLDDLD